MMRVELGGLWPQENRRGGAGRGVAVWERLGAGWLDVAGIRVCVLCGASAVWVQARMNAMCLQVGARTYCPPITCFSA